MHHALHVLDAPDLHITLFIEKYDAMPL